jgi:hypothetical protein
MLLAAWNSGNLARLLDAIYEVERKAACPESRESDERERMDTILAVAERMQAWLHNNGEGDSAELRVSMKLLRHLAGADWIWKAPPSASLPKVALRLEMRAFSLR